LNTPTFPRNDRNYKQAFVDFIKSRTWHWFITIPIGQCDNDECVLKLLRRIENQLCRRYLVNRYHKLPDDARFSMVVAFEGEYSCGTRHAHVLAYIPIPTKKRISHQMLSNLFPWEFRVLWVRFRQQLIPPSQGSKKNSSDRTADWLDQLLEIEVSRANDRRTIYAVKDVRQNEIPWSRFEFVTAPKSYKFLNENLSVIHNRSRQRRNYLKRKGDPLLTGHVV
jgi:hypothetical protein